MSVDVAKIISFFDITKFFLHFFSKKINFYWLSRRRVAETG